MSTTLKRNIALLRKSNLLIMGMISFMIYRVRSLIGRILSVNPGCEKTSSGIPQIIGIDVNMLVYWYTRLSKWLAQGWKRTCTITPGSMECIEIGQCRNVNRQLYFSSSWLSASWAPASSSMPLRFQLAFFRLIPILKRSPRQTLEPWQGHPYWQL